MRRKEQRLPISTAVWSASVLEKCHVCDRVYVQYISTRAVGRDVFWNNALQGLRNLG